MEGGQTETGSTATLTIATQPGNNKRLRGHVGAGAHTKHYRISALYCQIGDGCMSFQRHQKNRFVEYCFSAKFVFLDISSASEHELLIEYVPVHGTNTTIMGQWGGAREDHEN